MRKIRAIAPLALILLIAGCSANSAPVEPTPEESVSVKVSEIPEASAEGVEIGTAKLIDDKTVIFEYGGSSSCPVSFPKVERDGEEVLLTVQVGNGEADQICTMDYRFAFWQLDFAEPVTEDLTLVFTSNLGGEPYRLSLDK